GIRDFHVTGVQTCALPISAEVLAQTLAQELGCGAARMLQISTQWEHIILFPLFTSRYYIVIQVERSVPLMLVMVDMERTLEEVRSEERRVGKESSSWGCLR